MIVSQFMVWSIKVLIKIKSKSQNTSIGCIFTSPEPESIIIIFIDIFDTQSIYLNP